MYACRNMHAYVGPVSTYCAAVGLTIHTECRSFTLTVTMTFDLLS